MYRITCIFFLFFSVFLSPLQAQQGNVWAFGYNAGLDFNVNPPKAFKTSPTGYSSSSIADCRGHLLFYGSSAHLYNRFGKLMPNGKISIDDGEDVIYIVPFQKDTSKYYYITQRIGNGRDKVTGLYYCIVDMTKDSGRGDVDTPNTAIKINGSPLAFTIIKNSNDSEYWIVSAIATGTVSSSLSYISDTAYVYPLTANGVGKPKKEPVTSLIFEITSQLKATHSGDHLVMTNVTSSSNSYAAIQYNFNNTYGILSNPHAFFDADPSNFNNNYFFLSTAEYSADDSFMYISGEEEGSNAPYVENFVYQLGTYSSLYPLELGGVIDTHSVPAGSGLQLGPDNAIYWGIGGDSFLHKIQDPDKYGSACNLKMKAIDLSPGTIGVYLPNIYAPVRNLKFNVPNAVCADSVHFADVSDTNYFKSFIWYFGDGDSSTKYSPWHVYKKLGAYNVLLVGINSCGTRLYFSDSVHVFLPLKKGFTVSSLSYSCQQATVIVHVPAFDSGQTYIYTYGDDKTYITADSLHVYTASGKYVIAQGVSNGSCVDTFFDTVKVVIERPPVSRFTVSQTSQCSPYNLQVSNTSAFAYSYSWRLQSPKGWFDFFPHFLKRKGDRRG